MVAVSSKTTFLKKNVLEEDITAVTQKFKQNKSEMKEKDLLKYIETLQGIKMKLFKFGRQQVETTQLKVTANNRNDALVRYQPLSFSRLIFWTKMGLD